MSGMKWPRWILGIAVAAVVVAACGTDESPTVQPVGQVAAGSPVASLFFDGVKYTDDISMRVAPGEPTAFVIDGVDVDVAELEVVGTSTNGRPGSITGVQVYRSTATGDANALYTFTPAQRTVNPEDGLIRESPAQWVRWTAADK